MKTYKKTILSFSDIDDCANVTCRNDGTCVDGVNNFTCSCPVGYNGDFCETGSPNRRRLCYFRSLRADRKCKKLQLLLSLTKEKTNCWSLSIKNNLTTQSYKNMPSCFFFSSLNNCSFFFLVWNGKFSYLSGEKKDSSCELKTFEVKFFDEPLDKSWVNYSQLKLSEDKFSWRSYVL